MSDLDSRLEGWLARELRRPLPADAMRARRIMAAVRADVALNGAGHGSPATGSVASRARHAGRRVWLLGLALAAGLAGIVSGDAFSLDRVNSSASPTFGDSVAAVFRDTLHLVQFALVAPNASRVAVVGDFNGWNASATPLALAESTGVWLGVASLARGRHRFAYVVDDTQWVSDRLRPAAESHQGRATSRLAVPRPN